MPVTSSLLEATFFHVHSAFYLALQNCIAVVDVVGKKFVEKNVSNCVPMFQRAAMSDKV